MVVLGLIIGIVIGFVLASLCHAGGDTDEADSNYFDLEEFCNNLNIDEDDIDDIETLGNFDLGELGVEEDD